MNRKGIVALMFVLLSTMSAVAQSFTLSGKVSDEEGNAIELATISCLEQGAVTMANLKGEYSLKLQSRDSVVVKFSMVGYQTRTRVLRNPKSNQRLLVTLRPMKALDEVVVTEKRRQTTGTQELDIKNAKQGPSTTGNAVEELIQQQAGVSSHNELSSQYNVRGGSFDENQVYINNVEIYRPLLIRSGQQEASASSIQTWLRRWHSRVAVSRQSMAIRCRQPSTSSTANPPNGRVTCKLRC